MTKQQVEDLNDRLIRSLRGILTAWSTERNLIGLVKEAEELLAEAMEARCARPKKSSSRPPTSGRGRSPKSKKPGGPRKPTGLEHLPRFSIDHRNGST